MNMLYLSLTSEISFYAHEYHLHLSKCKFISTSDALEFASGKWVGCALWSIPVQTPLLCAQPWGSQGIQQFCSICFSFQQSQFLLWNLQCKNQRVYQACDVENKELAFYCLAKFLGSSWQFCLILGIGIFIFLNDFKQFLFSELLYK